jgi:hypothetical protein
LFAIHGCGVKCFGESEKRAPGVSDLPARVVAKNKPLAEDIEARGARGQGVSCGRSSLSR